MADNFISLYNRLLNRCPAVGVSLAQQLINDSWREIQSRREWSWRRGSAVFSPPDIYQFGHASTNAVSGDLFSVFGNGVNWTPNMVGRQFRGGGINYPIYTIKALISSSQLQIDKPWSGPDLNGAAYTIFQSLYPVPDDFGYFYAAISIKNNYRLWTSITESDLSMMDPQRTNQGETYAIAFNDYTQQYNGVVGPVIPMTPGSASPVSSTVDGFSYPANATYIIQVTGSGPSGTASYRWMRAGQTGFGASQVSSTDAQELTNGVMVYWPDGLNFTAGDLFAINCTTGTSSGVPRYELWPAPTWSGYLYPYIYTRREYDLTEDNPNLPIYIANRGDVILEKALEKCAEFPGQDADHLNIYHDLNQARYHGAKAEKMLVDIERNDEEIGVSLITYQDLPFGGPWSDGQWMQSHSPFYNG